MSKLFSKPNPFLAFSKEPEKPTYEPIYFTAYATACIAKQDYVDPETGEVIAHKGDMLTAVQFNRIAHINQ